jgi:hypothetical protein
MWLALTGICLFVKVNIDSGPCREANYFGYFDQSLLLVSAPATADPQKEFVAELPHLSLTKQDVYFASVEGGELKPSWIVHKIPSAAARLAGTHHRNSLFLA